MATAIKKTTTKKSDTILVILSVLAQAVNRENGKAIGEPRWEDIGIANPLFANCKTVLQAKEAYEAFWNKLNPTTPEIVFVHRIACERISEREYTRRLQEAYK